MNGKFKETSSINAKKFNLRNNIWDYSIIHFENNMTSLFSYTTHKDCKKIENDNSRKILIFVKSNF